MSIRGILSLAVISIWGLFTAQELKAQCNQSVSVTTCACSPDINWYTGCLPDPFSDCLIYGKWKSFTASCTGTYTLTAMIASTCKQKCRACVKICESQSDVAWVTTECSLAQNSVTANLVQGHTYSISVCKIACDGHSCSECETCPATGCATIGSGSCIQPNCNGS
jgi:hypothetical protein